MSTEAPTSGSTAANLEAAKGDGEEWLDFVTLMAQYYAVHGKVMDLATAVGKYYFTEEEFTELIKHPKVEAALIERKILRRTGDLAASVPLVNGANSDTISAAEKAPSWKDSALSPEQLIVANTMLDLIDTRSRKKKLQDMQIDSKTYNTWLKDENFQKYMRERAEEMLKENSHEAHLALLDKVNQGDQKAIEFYYELTDRYKKQSVTLNEGSNQAIDFQGMIVKIIEIVNDEVDAVTAMRISNKLEELIMVNSQATRLVSSTIEQPKIMPARELTPQMQKLMDSGVEME